MGRCRYRILEGHDTYFVTCACLNWMPLFNQPELAHIVLDSLQYLHNTKRLTIHAYVLMEDHFHLVGSSENFFKEIMSLKSFTARGILDSLKRRGYLSILRQLRLLRKRHKEDQTFQVWQEGFHPVAVQNETVLLQKIEYVHNNPVRRGFVDEPCHWRYSSARQYDGRSGLIPVQALRW